MGKIIKRFAVVVIVGVVLGSFASCGGGGSLKVDTGLEELTGIDNYDFTWVDGDKWKRNYEDFCSEDEKCYLLDGTIKEITLESYLPEELRGSCDVGGDLTIDDSTIESALEDGATIVLAEEDFEVFTFETQDGETIKSMSFYIEDCDYVRITVKT